MLFPLFPLNPQRLARLGSTPFAPFDTLLDCCDLLRGLLGGGRFLEGLLSRPLETVAPPPRIAETEECAQRACFLIAEVTVIHSVVIRATGSTAIAILRVVCTLSSSMLGMMLAAAG